MAAIDPLLFLKAAILDGRSHLELPPEIKSALFERVKDFRISLQEIQSCEKKMIRNTPHSPELITRIQRRKRILKQLDSLVKKLVPTTSINFKEINMLMLVLEKDAVTCIDSLNIAAEEDEYFDMNESFEDCANHLVEYTSDAQSVTLHAPNNYLEADILNAQSVIFNAPNGAECTTELEDREDPTILRNFSSCISDIENKRKELATSNVAIITSDIEDNRRESQNKKNIGINTVLEDEVPLRNIDKTSSEIQDESKNLVTVRNIALSTSDLEDTIKESLTKSSIGTNTFNIEDKGIRSVDITTSDPQEEKKESLTMRSVGISLFDVQAEKAESQTKGSGTNASIILQNKQIKDDTGEIKSIKDEADDRKWWRWCLSCCRKNK